MERKVLFLCGANSCRSQMAEGWARHLLGNRAVFFSAGLRAGGVDPLAVEAMAECGVDISGHTSKTLDELTGPFHIVITVCDSAREVCPYVPALELSLHRGFPDPPALARTLPEEERINPYREVCQAVRSFVHQDLRDLLEAP